MPPHLHEREITEPVSLTRPNGRLNPEAVGWARQPLLDTSGIGGARFWGRNKRWEYWNVITPTHILALTVSSLDYAGVHEVWVLDRRSHEARSANAVTPFAGGVMLPGSLGEGTARATAKNLAIEISEEPDGTRVRAEIDGLRFDVAVALPSGHERLGVVVPWSDRLFQYTVKDVARPASGMLWIDGVEFPLRDGDCWAVLDHGRGRWPYDVRWNWGAGSGESNGHVLGIQIGGQWTDGTGSTENAFLVDGRLHKISEELRWEFDAAHYLAPWRISGESIELTLEPFYDKISRTDLGILSSSTHQCFGRYSGWFRDDRGTRIEFHDLVGWAEDVRNRW
ncbi:Protein of unknown function [Paramicrobacterium humi]|uniref:DUF2804 domain-containing protein n=1 Tax=Paramicrobacterium humi TaxID=640635 RepID=A0A1H4K040_9MICO|nr:DUF2804 domain-containing protein [Microbacterium humi]SEB51465.1 Protein of unknown function [Microbacterium humi]